ncbi:Mob1/phocein [Aspergillus karnatakaensis]|uniref:Mob1 family protein n=1 Tax=Aspergillus karnatakaensis TaxID=1810916 RepID=UPI003CCD2442
MAAAGVSPSSSPRLPSPPPFTEVQIGPQSPSVGESFGSDADLQLLGVSPGADDGPTRRIRPGSKSSEMSAGPPLVPLSQLDSPFQLQEHLKALYSHYTRPENSDTVLPIRRGVARKIAEAPEGIDRMLWLYELCRFLTMKINDLVVAFFAENPPCSAQTCPEMRASEWQYLCAVHDPPKACCAIDYCCHTLDWAANILTSPKHFPSRLTMGSESGSGRVAGHRHLTNIFRRLYRIFAHAWFQHREVFCQVEGNDGLFMFFLTVCDEFELIPADNYTIPPEAVGEDPDEAPQPRPAEDTSNERPKSILRKDDESLIPPLDEIEPPAISTGATTRRHKSSPSIGSRVTTISESAEDTEEPVPLPSLEVKENEETEEKQQAEPLVESPSAQSPTQNTESQVTVAEVDSDEEASAAAVTPPSEEEHKEHEPTEIATETATEAPQDDVPDIAEEPKTETAVEPKADPEPEVKSEPQNTESEPETKTEMKSEAKEKEEAVDEPAKEG